MSNKGKIFLYSFLILLAAGFSYLYIWEKPKLERVVELYVENFSQKDDIPFTIDIGRTNFSIFPLQLELYNTKFGPKKDLRKYTGEFRIEKVSLRPSFFDLLVGKFWLSLLKIEGSTLDLNIPASAQSADMPDTDFELNSILKRIPISEINIQNFKVNANYQDKYFVTTESLYVKAYNEKSSLIVTVKDPNLGVRKDKKQKPLNFLTEFQLMVTSNTVSLSKVKLVKETSYFLASGNFTYDNSPENIEELNINTRINSNFSDINRWVNLLHKTDALDILKGNIKTDFHFTKKNKKQDIVTEVDGDFNKLQIENVILGDLKVNAKLPDTKHLVIERVEANLSGDNKAIIDNIRVNIGEDKTTFQAGVQVKQAQLHSFLRDSTIADIPVWLQVDGSVKCEGVFEKNLKVECPGAATVSNIKIQNGERTKNIVAAKKAEIAGTMTITEKNISYKAQAQIQSIKGKSSGVISYEKGFDIQYESENLNLAEISPIADLQFAGMAKTKGSTKGNSDWATFQMDISASQFEFEQYFFGEISTQLKYKSGTLFFEKLKGNIESTRYQGMLNVNLTEENIKGDIQLPFFRMADIQQSILKKVDLEDRFLGSGSGRIQLNTPFDVDQLNFILDARLFKGEAFGEQYNEASLEAESVDGIIILQQCLLEKEKSKIRLKGTIDTQLESNINFSVSNGFLQHSTILKEQELPISGTFQAQGEILGNLGSPVIKTKAKISQLIFNKKKYKDAIFAYDNSNKQTNLQFNIPEQLEFLVILPESDLKSLFVDVNANQLDIAPILGFVVSEDSTRSYVIETSGEISGNFDTRNFWNSEFSSTIRNISLNYKANKIETTIPTNIELKNGKLFLNEISVLGNRQFLKVTQPYTEEFRTKFIINSRMNIAFFKIFAPFIEKIDGYSTLRLELTVDRDQMKLIGSSYTTDSFLKFPGFPHPLEDISADILFNQNKVLINSISGQMAGGNVRGSGEVRLPGDGKFDIEINTNIENANIDFPEGFKTRGNANISLSGSEQPFKLSGNYDVLEGLIESNFSGGAGGENTDLLEELLKKEITSPLILDIDIDTKNSVEVRNSLVDGYISGKLKIFDKIDTPRISGEAFFDNDSVIKFREQEFDILSSNFSFEGEHPINPKLAMSAKTRVNGYDVNLLLQGRASKPVLNLTSQPPLPESQIISMLALGQLPDEFDPTQQNSLNSDPNAPQQQGFEVGTSLLGNNPLGRELKERYDVDVEVSTSFDDQTNSAVPRVTLRRKISKKLELSGSSTTGENNRQEGRVTYELNDDISTIFRLRNRPLDQNNLNSNPTVRQNNSFGVDVEYKVEFD